MVAPTNNPIVTSVPLNGRNYLLGETTNQFQPFKDATWGVIIPSTLLGNEVIAGYAAFSTDNVNVTRGTSSVALANFIGFVENMYLNEWDVGSLTGNYVLGNNFSVPVCSIGDIYVYNSTAISASVASGLLVVTSITTGTTPAAIQVGSVIQGSTPAGSTVVDISTKARVRMAQTTVGAGCLISLITA